MSTETPMDHLYEARVIAHIPALAESPDDRSVPYLLTGILHALIAVADRLPAPTLPAADETGGA